MRSTRISAKEIVIVLVSAVVMFFFITLLRPWAAILIAAIIGALQVPLIYDLTKKMLMDNGSNVTDGKGEDMRNTEKD